MEKIDLINNFVKMLLISFFIYLTYEKITNCKNRNINYIIVLLISAVISMMYLILNKYLPPLITIIVLYTIYAIIINKIIEHKINYVTYIYSCVISYLIYVIAIIITGVLVWLIGQRSDSKNPGTLIMISSVTFLLYYLILKTRRFKNGFNFLKSTNINKKIIIFTVLFSSIVISLYVLFQNKNEFILNMFLIIGSIIIAIVLVAWIKTQITKTYKNKMRDRTIEIQKTEIDEQAKLIEDIKAENLKLATAVHKYNSKFESLEHAMKSALSLDSKTEFANEISVILKESEETLKNFAKEVEVNTNKLPLTNIAGIDKMFKYMQEEAANNNINFDLKINESINPLIENIIPKEKFEILIGDHLKDAIIAIKASEATYKSILVTLGLVEGIYEFSIYDTGIEFEIDTLLKLGEEQVTTHKNEGGSGIGFMTTFETLKECKASLIIEEYNPETTNYTKSVTIKFDGRNEYKICSYRAEKIKEQKSKRRIIIEKMR